MKSFQFVFLALGVIAVSLDSINALSTDEKNKIYEGILPYVKECSKEFGISDADLKQAKESGQLSSLNPCLMGCVFKKIRVINDEGLFDTSRGDELTQKFLGNSEDKQKAVDLVKSCYSVNEQQVSDGEKGCERAKLLLECFLPLLAEFRKA